MTCATCRHYRPRRVQSQCALTRQPTKHDHTCDEYDEAPRETLEEYIDRGGVVHRAARGESGRSPHDWGGRVVKSSE